MKVHPKRNKPFVCEQCGERIDTDEDYRKVIFISFANSNKHRYSFCSQQCFDNWNLIHAKGTMPHETLEEELNLEVYDRDAEREEEEEHYIPDLQEEKGEVTKADGYVREIVPPEYKGEIEPEATPELAVFDTAKDVKEDIQNIDRVSQGYVYEKGFTGRKQLRTRPLSTWEKFRDKLKVLKILYDRDDWK